MKKVFYVLILSIFACSCGHRIVTMEEYSEIEVGMTKEELLKQLGPPYSIQKLTHNQEEYEYIERISVDEYVVEERHYFFLIKDGKVYSKSYKSINPPPLYHRNAYELQTSFNKEF